jgi:hypothetical protein
MMFTPFSTHVKRGLLIAAVAMSLASSVQAAAQAQFDSAFAVFTQARGGNEAAIHQAAVAFTNLHQAEPINPVLMAYAGAATSMRANTTWMPWKKMSFAEDGMALLDKALALLTGAHVAPLQGDVPANLEVKFIAANTFLAVPGFMNRGARGAKLLGEITASPLLNAAPLGFKGDVWLSAADLAIKEKRLDDARKYLNDIVKSSAPQAEAARAQLKTIQS